MIIAFHKPFGVLSQFTPDGSKHRTLAEFDFPKGMYPVGRLDAESEGLLLLSDEPELNARLPPSAECAHTDLLGTSRTSAHCGGAATA